MKHSHRCKGPPDGYIGYVGSVRRSFIGLDKVGYKISGQLPRTERKPGIRKNSIINMEFFAVPFPGSGYESIFYTVLEGVDIVKYIFPSALNIRSST